MRYSCIFLITIILFPILLFAQTTDSVFMQAAIKKLKDAKEYTMKTVSLMPAEKFGFKPTKQEMSFGEQVLHLSANMGWLCSSYLGKESNPVSDTDMKLEKKESIMLVLDKAYDFALTTLEHFDTKNFSDKVDFFAGPMNKLQIINLLNDHQTHHRAQMLVYLRLNGIKPPDYVGW
jgi:uncharacterized damage-inducible protein DinB